MKNTYTLDATTTAIRQLVLDNRELLPVSVRSVIATGHDIEFQLIAKVDSSLDPSDLGAVATGIERRLE